MGPTGPTGPIGPVGGPVAFFTGAVWAPTGPGGGATALQALQSGRVLDFGVFPAGSGAYLFHLAMQVGFYTVAGGSTQNGTVQLLQSGSTLVTFPWAMINTPWTTTGPYVAPSQIGASPGLDFWFQATVANGGDIQLKAFNNFYLLGAQLTCFSLPTVVTSPGFLS